jgi:hypothetical protein
MTRLLWDQVDERRYEQGVSHGVLYPSSGPGVVWKGLTGVDEGSTGEGMTSYHFEGVKYLDNPTVRTFQAVIRGVSSPPEFGPCVGDKEVRPGFTLTRQPRERFGFSYRTEVTGGYKIHVVYNALTRPVDKAYATLSESPNPTSFEWQIDAVPVPSDTYRPSPHLFVDSTKTDPAIFAQIEDLLYGTEEDDATLPLPSVLIDLCNP